MKRVGRPKGDPVLLEFRRGRRAAKQRGIGWALTAPQYRQLLADGRCYYCGVRLSSRGVRLDRVDNDRGYVLNNVVPCCGKCNLFKGGLSEDEFLERIQTIAIHRNLLDWKRWEVLYA